MQTVDPLEECRDEFADVENGSTALLEDAREWALNEAGQPSVADGERNE